MAVSVRITYVVHSKVSKSFASLLPHGRNVSDQHIVVPFVHVDRDQDSYCHKFNRSEVPRDLVVVICEGLWTHFH